MLSIKSGYSEELAEEINVDNNLVHKVGVSLLLSKVELNF
jgi:hypothetical protein